MRYEIEITRVSYSTLTFGVEANSEKEAREKALDEARNTSFDEDDADYEIISSFESGLTDEEWEDEYGA